jgi:hypothetical protein
MTKEQHDKLIYLHNLMSINGVINMKANELDEYSRLMALSLSGKGDVPMTNRKINAVPQPH